MQETIFTYIILKQSQDKLLIFLSYLCGNSLIAFVSTKAMVPV